jgi:hypothetical protein
MVDRRRRSHQQKTKLLVKTLTVFMTDAGPTKK